MGKDDQRLKRLRELLVLARGVQMVEDGALLAREGFLDTTERNIELLGQK